MSLILQKLESLEKQVQELKEENINLNKQIEELNKRVQELEMQNSGMYRVMDMRAQQELEIRQTGH
ncbi:hypothetical protein BCR44DRAFT_47167 [Catenaria anguillulae PL171]|uniref:Uncharacterized protein n=1 Tax=Catenaria anguillulae PL171 TaxID=765915 RepID=A0A1Y2H5V0_9FUNG|nr:hypothetical protein BCR44DRAFT_47167 [Catenaria anguillulae PL171]